MKSADIPKENFQEPVEFECSPTSEGSNHSNRQDYLTIYFPISSLLCRFCWQFPSGPESSHHILHQWIMYIDNDFHERHKVRKKWCCIECFGSSTTTDCSGTETLSSDAQRIASWQAVEFTFQLHALFGQVATTSDIKRSSFSCKVLV